MTRQASLPGPGLRRRQPSGDDLLAYGFTDGIGAFNLCYDNTDTDEGGLVDPYRQLRGVELALADPQHADVEHDRTSSKAADDGPDRHHQPRQPEADDAAPTAVVQTLRPRCTSSGNWLPSHVLGRQRRRGRLPADRHQLDADVHRRHLLLADRQRRAPRGGRPRLPAHGHPRGDPRRRWTTSTRTSYLDRTNCNPHRIEKFSSPGCAWTEGFAEWVPASVLEDPYYRFATGAFVPLETPTWGTPDWDVGLAVEGRVAGAMIDLEDIRSERLWDRWAEGGPPRPQWTTFLNGAVDPDLLRPLRVSTGASRASASTTGPGRSVYQNTINMGFYDPLTDGTELAPTDTGAARLPRRHDGVALVGRGAAGAVRVELRPRPVRQPQRGRASWATASAPRRRPGLRDGRLAPAAARGLLPEGVGHRGYRLLPRSSTPRAARRSSTGRRRSPWASTT